MFRTALLCLPTLDADALAAVRALLRAQAPACVVVTESSVGMQRALVSETLRRWCDEEEMDLVLTIGGTLPAPGPSAAEVVPEATLEVLDRLVPGLPETMRADALATTPLALLDRGVAGIRSRTLIVNLPEGHAAVLFLAAVADLLPALLAHLQGDPAAPRLATLPSPEESDPAPPAAKGLDADEFAAFLKRHKP
jgi:molybdopterin biosynthesis enzyme MoaB